MGRPPGHTCPSGEVTEQVIHEVEGAPGPHQSWACLHAGRGWDAQGSREPSASVSQVMAAVTTC